MTNLFGRLTAKTSVPALMQYTLVFLFFGCFLLFLPNTIQYEPFEWPKLLALYTGVGVLNLLFFWKYKNVVQIKHPKAFYYLALFFLGHVLAFIFSTDRSVSFLGSTYRYQGFATQLHYVLLALQSFWFFSLWRKEGIARIWKWIVGMGLVSVFLAVIAFVIPIEQLDPALYSNRAFGPLGNPNVLGAIISFLFPVLAAFFWDRKWLLAGGSTLLASGLFLSGSRSALIALLASTLFATIFTRSKKMKRIGFVSIAALAGVLICVTIFSAVSSAEPALVERFSLSTEQRTSIFTRFAFYESGLNSYLARPLTGYGQDMIAGNIDPYLPAHVAENDLFYVDRLHSELFDMLVMSGPLTVLGYIGFFVMIFISFLKTKERDPKAFAVLCGVFGLHVYLLFNFSTISIQMVLFFSAGYLLSSIVKPEEKHI